MACKANRNKIPITIPLLLGLLLILSCAGFQGLSPHQDEISTVYVEKGLDFYNHKDFTGAIEKFNKAIETDPANARADLQGGGVALPGYPETAGKNHPFS